LIDWDKHLISSHTLVDGAQTKLSSDPGIVRL